MRPSSPHRIALWNHRLNGRAPLAAQLAAGERFRCAVADDLEAAVRQADLVTCATLSAAARCRRLAAAGSHLDLRGRLQPRHARDGRRGPACARRCSATRAAAKTEGGDVALALIAERSPTGMSRPTSTICAGRHAGRTRAEEITLFKSVGTAIEDLAAAILVWRRPSRLNDWPRQRLRGYCSSCHGFPAMAERRGNGPVRDKIRDDPQTTRPSNRVTHARPRQDLRAELDRRPSTRPSRRAATWSGSCSSPRARAMCGLDAAKRLADHARGRAEIVALTVDAGDADAGCHCRGRGARLVAIAW